MSFACGRIAVLLEVSFILVSINYKTNYIIINYFKGGYCLKSLAEGAALTLKSLLRDPCPLLNVTGSPCDR